MIGWLLFCALCLGLSGCAADSRSDLAREVSELVMEGMPLDSAKAVLVEAGFQCTPSPLAGGNPAMTLCSRTRSHHIVASCVQNVYLTASADGRGMESLDIAHPSCTGL